MRLPVCCRRDEKVLCGTCLIGTDFPGFTAFAFEEKIDIVIEHILGRDVDDNKPKETGGAFGRVLAWYR